MMTTPAQHAVYTFIKNFMADKGYSPSFAEIAIGVGLRSKSLIHRHVHALAEAGLLQIKPGRRRQITLNSSERITIPVWISLPSLQDPLHHAFQEYFALLGFTEEHILDLKKTQSFVVVLDAYDETRGTKNILVGNKFHEWDAKIIITCRREYLYHEDNYAKRFFMPFHGDKAQPLLYSEWVVKPFNPSQIDGYLQQAVAHQETVWKDWQQYQHAIAQRPALQALVTTPFLLKMAITVLPEILEQQKTSVEKAAPAFTQAALYDAFIQRWFIRQEAKLKENRQIAPDKDIKPEFWSYAKALAKAMHDQQVTQVTYAPKGQLFQGEEMPTTWSAFFNPEDTLIRLLLDLLVFLINCLVLIHGMLEQASTRIDHLIAQLFNEVMAVPANPLVAYRHGIRFTQHFKPYHAVKPEQNHFKTGGVYVVTGGLGKIGITLANFLASDYKAHLILTTRSSLPYESILEKDNVDPLQASDIKLISQLREIKKKAASLHIRQADVANIDQMRQLFNQITAIHPHIDGVFHLAAVANHSARVLIKDLTPAKFYEQCLPKIQGTDVIEQLVNEFPTAFCLLFSSVASRLGGVGLCSYSASNCYLDSFAESQRYQPNGKTNWFSISWDAWQFNVEAHSLSETGKQYAENSLTGDQGIELMKNYFDAMNCSHLIFSFKGFNTRLAKWVNQSLVRQKQSAGVAFDEHPIDSTSTATREKMLIQVFKDCLGLSDFDIQANFYALGGDSLAAIHLLELIESRFSVRITLSDLFENPTIANLCQLIQEKKQPLIPSNVVNLKQSGDKSPLFFIHPIGGTVFCYLELAKYLPLDHPCYAIQDPGIESEHYQFETLEALAGNYLKQIQHIQPKGPYLLGGYSFGSNAAFEIAKQLMESGESVSAVFMIDGWTAFSRELRDHETFHVSMQRVLAEIGEKIQGKLRNEKALLHLFWERMKLLFHYKPSPVATRLLLFKAQEILPEYQSIDEATNHWSDYSTLPIEVHGVEGNHSTILQARGSQQIGDAINRFISQLL